MRAALMVLLLAAAGPAAAGAPLSISERQVVTLEFDRPVLRLAITDPDLVTAKVTGAHVAITALRAGRATLEVSFADGATAAYDVTVEGVRRAAVTAAAPAANELELFLAEERRFRFPGVARALVEENGVARVSVQGETVSVVALAKGQASLVLVDGAGAKTAWLIRVR
jgi:hypothetical protein